MKEGERVGVLPLYEGQQGGEGWVDDWWLESQEPDGSGDEAQEKR